MTTKLTADDFYSVARTTTQNFMMYSPDNAIERDDVVQDLVLDLWEKYEAGKFESIEEAYTIAHNKLTDQFRVWGREFNLKQASEAGGDVEPHDRLESQVNEAMEWYLIGDKSLRDMIPSEWRDVAELQERMQELEDSWNLTTRQIEVSGKEIQDAMHEYKHEIRAIQTLGYEPLPQRLIRDGFILIPGTITYPFLARLTKALVMLGTTPTMARRVIHAGLRMICKGAAREEDSQLLRNYRRRAGEGLVWTRHPRGDIVIRRGNARLFIAR